MTCQQRDCIKKEEGCCFNNDNSGIIWDCQQILFIDYQGKGKLLQVYIMIRYCTNTEPTERKTRKICRQNNVPVNSCAFVVAKLIDV